MQGDAALRLRISVQAIAVARRRKHNRGAFESRDASKTRSARKRRRERTVNTRRLRKSRARFGRIVTRKTRSLRKRRRERGAFESRDASKTRSARKRRRERTKTYVTKERVSTTPYCAADIGSNYSPAWRTPRMLSSFSVRPTPRSMRRLPRRASTELMPMPPIISCNSCVQAWTRLTSRL